ncbi:MAG: hypothetical protein KGK03_00580 [Candidatus Omnitrophica bacterium]|nr:hypothetical protein [Candidatus Omnitrophota bacterium]MDE2221549.1 hypothetical protein [Candidatus Omnitrophota bacterium]
MKIQLRNTFISIFVVVWLAVFYYESTCEYYWQPLLQRSLPRMKFLFPPAGWVMFYNIGDDFGYAQVYGVKDGEPQAIDPHQILRTRAIGYDNIHRNALISVLEPGVSDSFCPYLKRRFPYFDKFIVSYVDYPHLTKQPWARTETVAYECD